MKFHQDSCGGEYHAKSKSHQHLESIRLGWNSITGFDCVQRPVTEKDKSTPNQQCIECVILFAGKSASQKRAYSI